MLERWLRLWFTFRDPVDRGTYVRHGVGLMGLKYGCDALLAWRFAGRFWTPLDYLNPLLSVRQQLLRGAPGWLLPLLVVIALPFLWIGVSMTMRRAVNAGVAPGLALLFFIPGLNLLLMLVLALLPTGTAAPLPGDVVKTDQEERLQSALLGVAASLLITVLSVGVAVYLRRSYSAGLFLGVPFTVGYISAYIYNYRVARPARETMTVALVSVTIAAGALVIFALEGLICVMMAWPLAVVIAYPGAALGRMMAIRHSGAGVGMALIVPLYLGVEPRAAPPVHEVFTVVE